MAEILVKGQGWHKDRLAADVAAGECLTYDRFVHSDFVGCYASRDLPAGHVVTADDLERWTAEELAAEENDRCT